MRDATGTTHQSESKPGIRHHPAIFVVLFLAVFFALQLSYSHSRGGAFEQFFIHTLTVKPRVRGH